MPDPLARLDELLRRLLPGPNERVFLIMDHRSLDDSMACRIVSRRMDVTGTGHTCAEAMQEALDRWEQA